MKNHDDDMPSAADAIDAQDALFDAAQAAILDAKNILISPKTRSAVAALRSELFGESPPPGVFALGSSDAVPTSIDRLSLLGRNVMIGMVQRWLDYLAVPTDDDDALALVRAAVAITSVTDGDVEMPRSPLHLIMASKLPVELELPQEVASLTDAQLREVLRALAPADLARLELLARP